VLIEAAITMVNQIWQKREHIEPRCDRRPMNVKELSGLPKALSLPVRLGIIRMVSERRLCVNAITHSLRISQPAVSQHLAVLRRAGLVQGEKSGYRAHYALNRARLRQFKRALSRFPDESPPAMEGKV
jgi:DNA-binding transcriptional ArsR family regulator